MNELHFADNLDVLRAMPAESVDLIYLDPPFNSNTAYGVIYGTERGGPSQAQSHAFEDMWKWGQRAQRALDETASRHLEAGALLDAFEKVFRGKNMMAYLAMMAVRLIEMRRVLKPTGSIYLHCDSTASSYLRVLMDAIFGTQRFQNEITWKRTTAHNDPKRYGRIQDRLLFYSKGEPKTFNNVGGEYSAEQLERYKYADSHGRYKAENLTAPHFSLTRTIEWRGTHPGANRQWRFSTAELERLWHSGHILTRADGRPRKDGLKEYLNENETPALQDLWTDISRIGNTSKERLPYPTQKPLALLERIISVSSNEGDTILDPFCGCGTAVEAAEKLKRRWIGIDVTYLAIKVIEDRLEKALGAGIKQRYRLFGRPEDAADARILAARDWLEFQKWVVLHLGGLPKNRPGADGGIDGIIRYHRVGLEQPNRAVVSVKGGQHVGVDAIHKLKSVIKREQAEMGILVCLDRPTRPMVIEAASEREVGPPSKRADRIQILTVDMLFQNNNPVNLPGIIDLPEIGRHIVQRPAKRGRKHIAGQGELLLPISGQQEASPIAAKRSIRPVDIVVVRPTRKRG